MFKADGSADWDFIKKMALAAAVLYGIYRFGKYQEVKAMALGAAGGILAKQVPFVKDVA